ncbi:MAG: energy transducer TonB [Saprospiraceae bacterium]|nr:energy transducer TonB [Saprospiraceae bacterium]
MDISVTGKWLVVALAVAIVLVLAIIMVIRNMYAKKSDQDLAQLAASGSPLENRNKYAALNVFQLSGTFFNVGLVSAVALTILAFSWTTYDPTVNIPDGALDFDDEIEIEPPRTAEPPPPPPPPPPPQIEEVPEEEIEEDQEDLFQDQTIEEESKVEAPIQDAPPPPPPPPPPPEPKAEEIFVAVEDMPRFPGCEDKGSKAEKEQCAQSEMLQFIYKNIKYPPIARENGVEGTCVVRFVVEPDGEITNVELVRDIGAQCGQEALRVVEMMPKWIPGKQQGRKVRVQFNLPVKFKLQ